MVAQINRAFKATIIFLGQRAQLQSIFTELFHVTAVPTVNEALALAQQSPTDCIFIPIQTTFHTISILKTNFYTAHIPLILLLEKKFFHLITPAITAGIDDYLITTPPNISNASEGAIIRHKIVINIARSKRNIDLNPLTRLPGNRAIAHKLQKRPHDVALYVDINNFKAYNDAHGFLAGDRIIQQTAQLLAEQVGRTDFLGHVGGDDFVVVTSAASAPTLRQKIKQQFFQTFATITITITTTPTQKVIQCFHSPHALPGSTCDSGAKTKTSRS